MKILIAVLVVGFLPVAVVVRGGGDRIEPGSGADADDVATLLADDGRRMELARACLRRMLTDPSAGGKADLVRVLEIAGFSLSKASATPLSDDPTRARFGFEYTHREQVKTVYWEAVCPVHGAEAPTPPG